ncbi:hypothetical protein BV22DRAFT_1023922, partial [Leucogyrophana mollusca]
AFLGTIGVARIFIANFSKWAHTPNILTKKFVFGPQQIAVQEDLKKALLSSTALRAIDYHSEEKVLLAVNTNPIVVRFYISQCDLANPKKHYFT